MCPILFVNHRLAPPAYHNPGLGVGRPRRGGDTRRLGAAEVPPGDRCCAGGASRPRRSRSRHLVACGGARQRQDRSTSREPLHGRRREARRSHVCAAADAGARRRSVARSASESARARHGGGEDALRRWRVRRRVLGALDRGWASRGTADAVMFSLISLRHGRSRRAGGMHLTHTGNAGTDRPRSRRRHGSSAPGAAPANGGHTRAPPAARGPRG
jgi:hypothetical protein